MNKLILELKNCYWIKNLQTEFDFFQKKTYAIYAPNGVMKTSFSKTFKDLSLWKDSKDLVFPDRETIRNITDENGGSILPENIFVIEPYSDNFTSDKISTLVVEKTLKDKYDKIYQDLDTEKNNFIKKLKGISWSTDCEIELTKSFSENPKHNFFNILEGISTALKNEYPKYDFKYNDIFDSKWNVKKFLDKNMADIDDYITKYEEIMSKSTFFNKSWNSFWTYQAGELSNAIEDNSFFEAWHSIELNNHEKITSAQEYNDILNQEIAKIVGDPKLKKIFDKIDKAIAANVELRIFRKVIDKNNLLITELKDYENFKRRVWLWYIDEIKNDLFSLEKLYLGKKKELEDIIKEALKTKTDRETAVQEFNERFIWIPFKLYIDNQEDVILKTMTPVIKFKFCDPWEEKEIEKKELLEVLSQWEKRALYLLNIIFEIQWRKKSHTKTIFIVDDIADSFDYKNKYAIIQYLNDIAKEDDFYQIILTHNFDFFRTIQSRFVWRSHCKMVIKSINEINIINAWYFKPFDHFKDHLHINNKILIASIPFIRNLAEYSWYKKQNDTDTDQEYEILTSLLHIKSNTNTITIQILEGVIKNILKDKPNLSLDNHPKQVIELIFELADEISLEPDTNILELENKILLSIAIRLKAEIFMINKINDPVFIESIKTHQTIKLIKKYKELYWQEISNIQYLEQVNLITPENIHLNSFMYEPILDMSDTYLKSLYQTIKSL